MVICLSSFVAQCAEKNTLVTFTLDRITNHTDNDLFLVPIKETPGNLILLKAHKTIKNIKLPLIKSQDDQEGIWSIENDAKQKLRKFRYSINYRNPGFPIEHIWVAWLLPAGLDLIDWQDEIDLTNYRNLSIGISIDLKGTSLENTEMDIKAIAQ